MNTEFTVLNTHLTQLRTLCPTLRFEIIGISLGIGSGFWWPVIRGTDSVNGRGLP
jgi:hypothetical protein